MHLRQKKQQLQLLTAQPEWVICQQLLQPVFPLGGGIAVSAAASAALGAISEDSSILGKSLIFVGLAEGVVACMV